MATARASSAATAATVTRLIVGAVGGLAGGIVFGLLMQAMGMMPMVAMLVGSDSIAVGWLVHLAIAAFIGAAYGLLVARWADRPATGAVTGVGYGAVWWVLGALLLMPAKLGMDVLVVNPTAWRSLLGHLLYGLVLGVVYALVAPRLRRA